MPSHTRRERERIAREKKSAGNVLGMVGSGLKAAALGQMSPAAKKKQEYLRQRAIIDKAMAGRGSKSSQSALPSQPKGFVGGVTSGRQRLIDAMSGKLKKKGSQR